MAFETFLTVDKQKPKKSRRIMYAVSVGMHGVLLAVGVAVSYAGVEDISPKNGTLVTFHQLPAAPPPAAGGAKKTPPKVKPRPTERLQPRLTALVAPRDPPKEETSEVVGPGVPEGKVGGQVGGVGIGDPPTETETHNVPPNVAKGYLAIDPQADQYRAHLPPSLARSGMSVWALLRVCVDRDGNVVGVTVLKSADPSAEASFISAIRTWRYTPFKVDNRPVPFCTNVRYEVRTTN